MRLLLVDDHPLFLEGLHNLLTAQSLAVIGTARDGFEALAQVRALHPDVVLMDIRMPRCNGLDATRLIKAEYPDIHIIMLTMSADDEDLFQAIRAGASGYLLKSQETADLYRALNELVQGQVALAPGLAQRVLGEFSRLSGAALDDGTQTSDIPEELSQRQVQVLTLVASGLPYKEVGRHLGLTERTIKFHMGEIIARLHLRNRADAVAFARSHGLARKH
jgi:DNA-binding NarL/FixJ family response regulator